MLWKMNCTKSSLKALSIAIREGNLEKVQKLVEVENVPITNLSFMDAVYYSRLDILSYFLDREYTAHTWSYGLNQAAIEGKLEIVELIINHIKNNKSKYQEKALHIQSFIDYSAKCAAQNNQLEIVKYLENVKI